MEPVDEHDMTYHMVIELLAYVVYVTVLATSWPCCLY